MREGRAERVRRCNRESAEALRWLVSNIPVQIPTERVCDCLLPKVAGYLLPFFPLAWLKMRCRDTVRLSIASRLLWLLLFSVYRLKVRRYDWPQTMEVDCRVAAENAPSQVRHATVCIALSMRSYSVIAVKLANALVEHGYSCNIIVPNEAERGDLRGLSTQVGAYSCSQFFSKELAWSYNIYRTQLASEFDTLVRRIAVDAPELVRDVWSVCPDQLRYVVSEVFPQIPVYERVALAALSAIRPRVLFVMRLKRITENVFSNVAKQLRIPVCIVNHGHISRDWNPLELGDAVGKCAAIFTWNKMQKETWKVLYPELDERCCHVVGGVQWDHPIRELVVVDRKEVLVKKRDAITTIILASGKRISREKAWITITMDDHMKPHLAQVVDMLTAGGHFEVFIKIRPSENEDDYAFLGGKRLDAVHLVSKKVVVDLFELFAASELVMACISTTNLDALAVGTPVVTLAFDEVTRNDERANYLRIYDLPYVTRIEQLSQLIDGWLWKNDIRKGLEARAASAARALIANFPAGNAADAITSIMETILANDSWARR